MYEALTERVFPFSKVDHDIHEECVAAGTIQNSEIIGATRGVDIGDSSSQLATVVLGTSRNARGALADHTIRRCGPTGTAVTAPQC